MKTITKENLLELLDRRYTNEQLAAYFECSVTTIKRRKKEFELVGYKTNKKPLTDKQLQELESLANKGLGFSAACKSIGVSPVTVRKYIPKNLHSKLNFNGNIALKESRRSSTFSKMLTPSKEAAYILGYLVTDGSISKDGVITAVSKDKELINYCSSFFEANVNTVVKDNGSIYYTFTAKDYRNMEKFKAVTNLVPNKTYKNYVIPSWVYDYIDYFIVGVFNGDGWAYKVKDRNSVEIGISQHENQRKFLEDLSRELNWDIYKNKDAALVLKTKCKAKVLSFSKLYCANPFSLARKADILLRYSLVNR